MSVYMTEEEQLAAIKNWWNKYSNVITVILSLLLLTMRVLGIGIGIKKKN